MVINVTHLHTKHFLWDIKFQISPSSIINLKTSQLVCALTSHPRHQLTLTNTQSYPPTHTRFMFLVSFFNRLLPKSTLLTQNSQIRSAKASGNNNKKRTKLGKQQKFTLLLIFFFFFSYSSQPDPVKLVLESFFAYLFSLSLFFCSSTKLFSSPTSLPHCVLCGCCLTRKRERISPPFISRTQPNPTRPL